MGENPFDVTKAVDFTDAEIAATWVEWPDSQAEAVVNPLSPMPTILTGGKGGGRTHLLRYFSYPLQRLRHSDGIVKGVQSEGYLGVYFRCGGLNSSRFAGKGQSPAVWSAVFAYYMEIWLGRLVLDVIRDFLGFKQLPPESAPIKSFADAVDALFDRRLAPGEGSPMDALVSAFQMQQRHLDLEINNAALTGRLDLAILASPGRLVFGIPQAAVRHLGPLADMAFVYLFDEYENLTEPQQRYVNTLIREKELPTRFLVGSRLYGLRSHTTLSAGEINREGSEYQPVVLEDIYRGGEGRYGAFCRHIVERRLAESGLELLSPVQLDAYFVVPERSLEERAIRHLEGLGCRTPPSLDR